MKEEVIKLKRKARRTVRIRKKILKRSGAPRLVVFRSNNHIYAQIVDDTKGTTLVGAGEIEFKYEGKMTKTQKAEMVGANLAKKAKAKKIDKVVFDKGSYKYHGRVKALAEAARKEGLVF